MVNWVGTDERDVHYGSSGVDFLYGQGEKDILYGREGGDYIRGGTGGDFLYGQEGNDTIHGDEGDDLLYGGKGDDTINGNLGADLLHGGAGNDVLHGGEGDDKITGDSGNDVMTGGPGSDTFDFSYLRDGNKTITDFNTREADVVDLTNVFADHDKLLKASAVLPVDGVVSTKITYDNGTVTLLGYDITKDASLQAHFKVGAGRTFDPLAMMAEQQITATYAAFLGREPDAGGLAFWVDQFNAGSPTQGGAQLFANVANSVGASDEARALHPFLANPAGASDGQIATFIDSVYHNLFDRGPDAEGLAYWAGQVKHTLQTGGFIGPVLANILSGAQGQDMATFLAMQAASGTAAATSLPVAAASDPESVVLVGIANDQTLIAAQA